MHRALPQRAAPRVPASFSVSPATATRGARSRFFPAC
jgi:hypothetical protein